MDRREITLAELQPNRLAKEAIAIFMDPRNQEVMDMNALTDEDQETMHYAVFVATDRQNMNRELGIPDRISEEESRSFMSSLSKTMIASSKKIAASFHIRGSSS